MSRQQCQAGAQILAGAILLSLAADLLLKEPFDWQQMFWSCYWAAAAVAAGIFFRSKWVVSTGLVFFAGLGTPAWIVGRLAQNQLDPTSILIHTLPLAAAALYIRQMPSLPAYSTLGAWSFYLVPLVLARTFTTSPDNINLSQSVWPPLESTVSSLWQFHAILLTSSAITITLAAHGIQRFLARHAAAPESLEGFRKAA